MVRKNAKVGDAHADRRCKHEIFRGIAMKIEHSAKPASTQVVKESRSASAKKTASASDEVQLSSLASQLLTTESESPFDADRVAEIKLAIAEGKFSINAGAIADRLIASARELVDSQQQS